MQEDAGGIRNATRPGVGQAVPGTGGPEVRQAQPDLQQVLAELDELIGLAPIKNEVRTLANYLKLERRRGEAGLSDTEISLHMVFTGNPGTGKTTVARIIGKIFAAMGVLKKGHLVETDRSGLVAGYAGQTGPKTNAKIDEALDGVLFIDEAYSLVAQDGQDPYGGEAVQAVLKRAEDDRGRLVVILAGYPDEMTRSSTRTRVCRRGSIGSFISTTTRPSNSRIFAWLCDKNHYKLADGTRPRLKLALPNCIGIATDVSATAARSATSSNRQSAEWPTASPTSASFPAIS